MKKSLLFLLVASFVLASAGTAFAFPVDFSGDVSYQFRSFQDNITNNNAGTYTDELGRLRLNFSAKVDQDVTLYGRFASRSFFGSSSNTYSYYDYTNNNLLDQYGVKIGDNGWTYNLGRQAISLGQGSIINTGSDVGYDAKFDGLVAGGKIGAVDAKFAVGKTTDSYLNYTFSQGVGYSANWWGADLSVPVSDNLTFGATYATEKVNGPYSSLIGQAVKYLGVNATFCPSSNLTLSGEYVKSNLNSLNKAYFIAGTYSWDKDWFCIQYNNVEHFAVDWTNSGIGAAAYPLSNSGLSRVNYGLYDGNKYSGFTYVYNHQLNNTVAFKACYMSLKADGLDGRDNEYAAGVQWDF